MQSAEAPRVDVAEAQPLENFPRTVQEHICESLYAPHASQNPSHAERFHQSSLPLALARTNFRRKAWFPCQPSCRRHQHWRRLLQGCLLCTSAERDSCVQWWMTCCLPSWAWMASMCAQLRWRSQMVACASATACTHRRTLR